MNLVYEKDGVKVEILGWDKDEIKVAMKVSAEGNETVILAEPDFEEMCLDELIEYRERVINKMDKLELDEPEDDESDEYAEWEDEYYDLEDILVEVEECIENYEDQVE